MDLKEFEDLFLNDLCDRKKEEKNCCRYKIRKELGYGEIRFHHIFPGLSVSISDFCLEKKYITISKSSDFSGNFIKMSYCLSGEYRFNGPDNRVGIVSKGEFGSYSGIDSFYKLEFIDKRYCTIGLLCYIDQFKKTLEDSWGYDGSILDLYYNKIIARSEYLIAKNDTKSLQLIQEIYNSAYNNDQITIRLKTVELFFREINLYLENKKQEKKYYLRSHIEKVARIKKRIDENYNRDFTVEDLSISEGINSSYLKTIFKDRYGDSIYSYKKNLRMKKAEVLLKETNMHIYEIVQEIGYTDAGKFTRSFKKIYNTTPGEYRSQ